MKVWTPKRNTSLLLIAGLLALNISLVEPPSAEAATCNIGSTSMGLSAGVLGTNQDSGTQTNPFPIRTVEDLLALDACIDASQTTGVFYQLTNDIDLAGSAISSPLGSDNKPFRGALTGASGSQVLRIENISFSATAPTAGFFHELFAATVSDLVLHGKISYRPTTAGQFGGVAGEVQRSLISNVVTYLELRAETAQNVNLGGIAGQYSASNFISISVAVDGSHGLIRSVAGNSWVGGIAGRTWGTGQSQFSRIRVSAPFEVSAVQYSARVGGIIGGADLSGLKAFSSKTTIERARVSSTLNVSLFKSEGQIGGLVGGVAEKTVEIRDSVFSGLIVLPTDPNAGITTVGGLFGGASDPEGAHMSVSNSVVDGAFRTRGQNAFLGGVSGSIADADSRLEVDEVLLNGVLGNFAPNGSYALANAATGTPLSVSGLIRNSDSWTSNLNAYSAALSSDQLADPATIALRDYSPSAADSAFRWNQCSVPYLSWLGVEGCKPSVVGSYIDSTGTNLVTVFSQRMESTNTSLEGLSLLTGAGRQVTLANPTWTSNARELHVSLSPAIQEGWTVSFEVQSPSLSSFSTSQQLQPVSKQYVVNLSTATGPEATIASAQASPSSISFLLSCGGSCGDGSAYSYVASVTAAGGASITVSGTATSATTALNFSGLSANTAHVIRASVLFSGQSSPTASATLSTPRPIATISSLSVRETSATLTVGCTNCDASPESFVITARPLAGGSEITSTTTVLSGLSSETSYSFSVVISFAGTTSGEVLWRSNPVMTLPFVPVVTSVTPSQLPAVEGGSVTVIGSNFSTSTKLTLNGSTLAFTVLNGSTLVFTAPAAAAGTYELAITNTVGTFTLSNALELMPQPSLLTNSPRLSTVNGGTIVTLTGANLATTTDVYVGQVTVSFTLLSDSGLRFVTFATVSGIVDIGVVSLGGAATLSNALEFTTSPLVPLIFSVTPSSGPATGGTLITVTGKNFSGSYSSAVLAAIGGSNGSSVLVIDDGTLTFVAPPGQGGPLAVSVITGGGAGELERAFSYLSTPVPGVAEPAESESPTASSTPARPTPIALVERLSTRSITVVGAEITIFGFQLGRIESAMLSNLDLKIVSNSSRQITLLIGPIDAGTWNLVLRGPLGTTTIFRAITVIRAGA